MAQGLVLMPNKPKRALQCHGYFLYSGPWESPRVLREGPGLEREFTKGAQDSDYLLPGIEVC